MVKSPKNWTDALGAHSSGFWRPKISVICGECQRPTTANVEETIYVSNRDNRRAVCCAHCGYWNLTNLVYE